MPATAPNHRLIAREHLAEATALADEGRLEDCRESLLVAMGHAIGQLAIDHRLDAPSLSRAMAVLSLRGVVSFDARPLWSALQRKDADAAGSAGPSGADAAGSSRPPGPDTAEAIQAVQSLVDLAAGVPGSTLAPARWQRWGASDQDEDGGDGAGEPMPTRAAGWARAVARERTRRRGRRLGVLTGAGACALALGALGLAWSNAVEGTEYRPPKADIGFFDAGS